jgi:hypothetical protein
MRRYGNKSSTRYGKVFKCKKGKHRGKLVKYSYKNGRKSTKKMVLHRGRKR